MTNTTLADDVFYKIGKEDLLQISAIDIKVKHLYSKLQERQQRAYSLQSAASNDVKVQKSRNIHTLEDMVLSIEETREQLLDALAMQRTIQAEKMEIISRLPLGLRNVIIWRYFDNKNLLELGFSRREIGLMHKEALIQYGMLISEE